MIDHIASLIFNKDGQLLVLRKKTVDNHSYTKAKDYTRLKERWIF